jgi:type IV pilus assembly protein PilW
VSQRARGFQLVELLIALAISLSLISAFLVFLQHARRSFTHNESVARLQDASRHVLGVITSDLEHAGFFGYTWHRQYELTAAGTVLATQEFLHQPTPARPMTAAPGLPAGAHDCGVNFAVDLHRGVQGSDNGYSMGAGARDCAPTATAGGASATSDTLTVRHASLALTEPRDGRLQLQMHVRAANPPVRLFADGRAPCPRDADHEIRDLEVRTYYVANRSVDRADWPALRVKSLTESRGGAQFRDEEVMPGVEDLQVEFGVSSLEAGRHLLRFVSPEAAVPRDAQVVSVRVWLRIRADLTEPGFSDARSLRYANVSFTPTGDDAGHRRELVSRTISLRNLAPT